MALSPQTSLAALPPEIRFLIFEYVFHAQHLRLRLNKNRSRVVPTVKFPMFSDCIKTCLHTHDAYIGDESMVIDAVMNLKDVQVRMVTVGESPEILMKS